MTSLVEMVRLEDREPSLVTPVVAAVVVVAVAFGGLGTWLGVARLDSAAVAPGTVIADGHRKTVQHLEGGIVRELLVREGDMVQVGQALVALDPTQARAAMGQVRGHYWAALARVARLKAEQDGGEPVFPEELTQAAATDAAAADLLAAQRRLFASRRDTQAGQVGVRRQRNAQVREEIAALEAQLAAAQHRQAYARQELDGVEKLYRKGYERKPRLLDLMGKVAELEGRRGELAGNIARGRQEIATTEVEIMTLNNSFASDVARELQDAHAALAEATERQRAAADVLGRIRVVAPIAGRVVDMKVFTVGGVVTPGQPIMDIAPSEDALIVEARVNPNDIEGVHTGLPANVRLTAYKQREVPPITGTVTHVSADRLTDPRTGEAHFLAHVTLSPEALREVPRVALAAGMPADVLITTGERRAIDYLISPLADGMRHAFREK